MQRNEEKLVQMLTISNRYVATHRSNIQQHMDDMKQIPLFRDLGRRFRIYLRNWYDIGRIIGSMVIVKILLFA